MMFGLLKRREKRRTDDFISTLSQRSDDFLKESYSKLDAYSLLGSASNNDIDELLAVDRELERRGFVHRRDY